MDPETTRSELMKASALIAMVLVAFSLLAGPLYRLSSATNRGQLAATRRGAQALVRERKLLGLAGAAFAALHVALSFGSLRGLATAILRARALGVVGIAAAVIALSILVRMAHTSSKRAKAILGAARWKRIHELGAVALVLSVTHFLCMEMDLATGLHVRAFGRIVLACAVTVLGVRALAWIVERSKEAELTAPADHHTRDAAHVRVRGGKAPM
jgi:DMSO/TMAO reductase YedYZ heme-binding membrane subunit